MLHRQIPQYDDIVVHLISQTHWRSQKRSAQIIAWLINAIHLPDWF